MSEQPRTIQRYALGCGFNGLVEAEPDPEGEWCLASDIEAQAAAPLERLRGIDNCIDIVQQAIDTARIDTARAVHPFVTARSPYITASFGARDHILRLLTGYREAVAREYEALSEEPKRARPR